MPFKMHKKNFFSENLKKILGFRYGWVTLNTGIFLFGLSEQETIKILRLKDEFSIIRNK